jgi:PQQ-dependent catabolism-associated CXXCW motif protein
MRTSGAYGSAALIAALLLTGCDRFGGAQGGGGQTPPPGFAPAGQMPQVGQMPQGMPGQQGPQGPQVTQGTGAPSNLDQLEAWERSDAGVAPSSQLHDGAMHGPTPNRIPGGQVISTKGLLPLINGSSGVPVLVLDVLGNPQLQLPNAAPAVFAAQPGDFNDQVQQQFGQLLMQLTQGNKQIPIVTYCQGPQCWMSYNAALRAIALGYRNVLWYRGGLEAWQLAMAQMAGVGGQPPAMAPQPGFGGGVGGG